jgi:hypothetical protein
MNVFAASVNSRVTLAKELPNETVFLRNTQQTNPSGTEDSVALLKKANVIGNMLNYMVGNDAIKAGGFDGESHDISSQQRELRRRRRSPTESLPIEIQPCNPITGRQCSSEVRGDNSIAAA